MRSIYSVMSLPPEILCLVFGSLEKPVLVNVRLVCKSFEEAASPFLFDQVYVSHTRADLETARLTVLRFGRYVRTLAFTPTYLEYDMHYFRNVTQGYGLYHVSGENEPAKCRDQHLEQAWNRYSGQRDEWREVEESGELVGYLCIILGKMPRLQTIKIRACSVFQHTSGESLKSPKLGSACSPHMCPLHDVIFEPAIDCLTNGTRAWHSLILALSITKACVKSFISEVSEDRCCIRPISCSAFNMLQARGLHVEQSFRSLIELRLNLTRYDYEIKTYSRDADTQANLAEILAIAINLEHLQLEFDNESKLFGNILGVCRLTKLRSLELSSIISTEDQLVGFLQSSPGLEILKLKKHNLTQGLWEHVAHRIKNSLHLHMVHLDNLLGGIPLSWDGFNLDQWWNPFNPEIYRDVDDFFLRDGENPFTKKAFERRRGRSIPYLVSILQFSLCLKAGYLQSKQLH